MNSRQKSFTLIEMTLVLFIMSVVMIFTLPKFAGFKSEAEMDHAIAQLQSLTQYGRSLAAIHPGESIELWLDPEKNAFFLVSRGQELDGTEFEVVVLPDNISIANLKNFPSKQRNGKLAFFSFSPEGEITEGQVGLSHKLSGATKDLKADTPVGAIKVVRKS